MNYHLQPPSPHFFEEIKIKLLHKLFGSKKWIVYESMLLILKRWYLLNLNLTQSHSHTVIVSNFRKGVYLWLNAFDDYGRSFGFHACYVWGVYSRNLPPKEVKHLMFLFCLFLFYVSKWAQVWIWSTRI
jgi:hypothetical protein